MVLSYGSDETEVSNLFSNDKIIIKNECKVRLSGSSHYYFRIHPALFYNGCHISFGYSVLAAGQIYRK